MKEEKRIILKGVRVNNLKNIDVEIPRNRLTVITGLSGSGKSSLAFDTLYAEGQRRYVESLSSYARQFLGRLPKPECDFIKGLPPAIAIEQKVNTRNTRSTVGTSTEIYDYFRLLFSRVGKTVSPVSGEEVRKHNVSDIVSWVMSYPHGVRFAIFAPCNIPEGRKTDEQLEILLKGGYTRISFKDNIYNIEEVLDDKKLLKKLENFEIVVDRLAVSSEGTLQSRIADSTEIAFYEGHGYCNIRIYTEEGVIMKEFSKKYEADGMSFNEPSSMMFNFNSPVGACTKCGGLGVALGIDENLVIPDKRLSIYQGAVSCWRSEGFSEWLRNFIKESEVCDFPIHRPYCDLSEKEIDILWNGNAGIKGINAFFDFLTMTYYMIQNRVMLSRYKGQTTCPLCKGSRLKPEALYVQVGGRNILQLVSLPVIELKLFFEELELPQMEATIARRILTEIRSRLTFLIEVGLGYLTLDRLSSSLSGGESQRINLATSLGSSLVGSLYILDEPSIGLHSRDTERLIHVLRQLQKLGNTVVVVEHDEEIIRSADYIIDIGPKAGRLGGEVVYQGDVGNLEKNTDSHTVRFLNGEERIPVPSFRRLWNNYIKITDVRRNNINGLSVKFPLNVMTVVTGVSGSGKSTLVRDILYSNVRRLLDESKLITDCASVTGDVKLISAIDFVDQNSIGRSSRSNPVTYIGAYDDIRKLFSEQHLSKRMNYLPSHFSFNKEGGRCEECKGEGHITVEMQFMADLLLLCDHCHGKRFKSEILEVECSGHNIYDILEMTVDQAIELFGRSSGALEKKISRRLQPLQDVGLGYIKLGQSSSTLSGGENQRVKLAFYLAQERPYPTLFIFDEPTTGLHFHDIGTLLKAFDALIEKGHTIIIIEHNYEVIKCADHVIDLGPEGGKAGGKLVCCGTPEEVARCSSSYTGRFLAEKLFSK